MKKQEIKSRSFGRWEEFLSSTIKILEEGGTVFIPISSRNKEINFDILEQLRDVSGRHIEMKAQYKEVPKFITLEPFEIGQPEKRLTGYLYWLD